MDKQEIPKLPTEEADAFLASLPDDLSPEAKRQVLEDFRVLYESRAEYRSLSLGPAPSHPPMGSGEIPEAWTKTPIPTRGIMVQSGFPSTADTFYEMVESKVREDGYWETNTQWLLRGAMVELEDDGTTVRRQLQGSKTGNWTAPRWALAGDIFFFRLAMKNKQKAKRLVKSVGEDYGCFATDFAIVIDNELHCLEQVGGCIFACARLEGSIEYISREGSENHWHSPYYSEFTDFYLFEKPIPHDAIKHRLRTDARQPELVDGPTFNTLRDLILLHNPEAPDYLANAVGHTEGIRDITVENWLDKGRNVTRRCLFESQVRDIFIDHLLNEIKDPGSKTYREVTCWKDDISQGRSDYAVMIGGTWFPVEAKLDVALEGDLPGQVAKYTLSDAFTYNETQTDRNKFSLKDACICLVVDRNGISIFDSEGIVGAGQAHPVWDRRTLSPKDFDAIRAAIVLENTSRCPL
ncbi:MAG: hypothetical protein RLY93_15340 [Sumerlaeia bacterium]